MTNDSYGYINHANPQTLNLYAYCENNPVSKVDPTGCASSAGFWGGVASFGLNAITGNLPSPISIFFKIMSLTTVEAGESQAELDAMKAPVQANSKEKSKAKGKSKASLQPYKNNKEANKAAQKQGYNGAEDLKKYYVGKNDGSKFDMKYDKNTKEIILERKSNSSVQLRTGLFDR